jgi:hypothetical protein
MPLGIVSVGGSVERVQNSDAVTASPGDETAARAYRRMRMVVSLVEVPFGAAYGFKGTTLGEYLADGYTITTDDPFGGYHEVSLEAFADADRNLFLDFRFEEEKTPGEQWPELGDNEVALKVWELVDQPAEAPDYASGGDVTPLLPEPSAGPAIGEKRRFADHADIATPPNPGGSAPQ